MNVRLRNNQPRSVTEHRRHGNFASLKPGDSSMCVPSLGWTLASHIYKKVLLFGLFPAGDVAHLLGDLLHRSGFEFTDFG